MMKTKKIATTATKRTRKKTKVSRGFVAFSSRVLVLIPFLHSAGKPERFRYVTKKDDRNTNPNHVLNDVFEKKRSVKAFKEKRKHMDGMNTLLSNKFHTSKRVIKTVF
jgi:hypothetical protein